MKGNRIPINASGSLASTEGRQGIFFGNLYAADQGKI